jgi:hypothetical protein
VIPAVVTVRRFLAAQDRVAVFCAIPAGFLGLIVMAGWIMRSPVLIQIRPGMSPMMFNTAVGLMLAAASLFGRSTRSNVATVCGALLMLLGGLTLLEYATARDIGIDQLLFRDWHSGSTPGRMGANSAVCFLLLGLASVFGRMAVNVGGMLALPVAIGVLSVSAAALLGYATGLEFSYRWGGTTRMAAHTAAAFMLLGVGMFFSSWRHVGRGRATWLAIGGGGCIAGIGLVVSLGLMAEQKRGAATDSRTAAADVVKGVTSDVGQLGASAPAFSDSAGSPWQATHVALSAAGACACARRPSASDDRNAVAMAMWRVRVRRPRPVTRQHHCQERGRDPTGPQLSAIPPSGLLVGGAG